nr:SIS domain-containing protein [Propionicimonas sp.]
MNLATIDQYLEQLSAAIGDIRRPQLDDVAGLFMDVWRRGGTVYTLGNGGSASLASHMACDLAKNTAPDLGTGPDAPAARRLRVIGLADNSALLTALGNDIDYGDTFVEQLKILLTPADVVLAVSGSGASPNVIRALRYARMVGATTVGLTGSRESAAEMLELSDYALVAPTEVMEQIEDLHVIFNHALAVSLRDRIATETVTA